MSAPSLNMGTLPRSGVMDGGVHRFPVRVYYEDTDAAGIVYYANYLKFTERARTEMMRLYGVEHEKARQSGGAVFIVRRAECEYRVSARLDDELVVETQLREIGGATILLAQDILRGATVLVRSTVLIACVSAAGRPVRLPAALRTAFPSSMTLGWSPHMPDNAVDQAVLAGSAPVHDLSVITLFLQADMIVKIVMLMLLCASFWSWAVIFDKYIKLRRLRRDADSFEEAFWSGGALDDLYDRIGNRPEDPMSSIFAAAMREWRRSVSKGLVANSATRQTLQQRIERVMQVTASREMARLERYMPYLATVGSTSPFVGLFGTVWGIMNSFASIAASKNTSLAVVAPGIAESLFATALGLVAAIPAVIFYNKFSTDFSRYAGRLEAFGSEFSAILSRQLDEKA